MRLGTFALLAFASLILGAVIPGMAPPWNGLVVGILTGTAYYLGLIEQLENTKKTDGSD